VTASSTDGLGASHVPNRARRSVGGVIVVAAVVGVVAFLFRFNALGGALGGFDNDQFIYLARADAILQGEQPLRDFVDAELRGAWPALSYLASAWAQQLGGRSLLPEAYLTVGALAAAHVLVFLLALQVSQRWTMALLASSATIAMAPKLYNYPKLLMLALGACVLRGVVASPTTLRLGTLALVTVAASLFRHDLGLYIGAATVAALVVRDAGRWTVLARELGLYAALTGVCAVPSLVWIQLYEGIPSYVRNGLASVAVERSRTELRLPVLDWVAPFSGDSLLLVTYYAFWAVPVVAACALLGRVVLSPSSPTARAERSLTAGLLVMAVLANASFLRANLAERFADSSVPIVLLAACTVGGATVWRAGLARTAAMTLSFLLVAEMLGAAYAFSEVGRELDTGGLSDSWGKTVRRYQAVRSELSALPPTIWSERGATGAMQAAGYVARCTGPEDRLLVTGAIHEILVLARRRFAAGQAMFKLSLYTSERDQRRALAKLAGQSVPVVLVDAREYEGGFVADYPLVAAHLQDQYREAGRIQVADEPGYLVFTNAHRRPVRVDPQSQLPCFQ
jgi:hypothetical protein